MPQNEEEKCPVCGGRLVWGTDFIGRAATPESTGFEVQYCEDCNDDTGERRFVGF